MSVKQKLMDNMMEKYFNKMSKEEKKEMMDSMMENFFSGMSPEEKNQLMGEMMPKMMGNMMGEGSHPMMPMMGLMMGKKSANKEGMKMPWDMCGEMMSNFSETANSAKFATPELRGLFSEWCEEIEKEMQEFIKQTGSIDVKALIQKFNLSEESINYLLGSMASKKKIAYKA